MADLTKIFQFNPWAPICSFLCTFWTTQPITVKFYQNLENVILTKNHEKNGQCFLPFGQNGHLKLRKFQKLVNLTPRAKHEAKKSWSTLSGARGLRNLAQPTTSSEARSLRDLGQPIPTSEAGGLRNLCQPITSSEARGSRTDLSSLKRDARCHMADIFYIWFIGVQGR